MEKTLSFDSLLVHGGLVTGPAGATAVPIVQSSSFAYETTPVNEGDVIEFLYFMGGGR